MKFPRKIRIRITLRPFPFMAVALVSLALLSAFIWQRVGGQQARETQAAPFMPSYYITDQSYYPDEALTACAEGYHFASLWEISDPSSLRYNSAIGQTTLDSGSGPPTIQGLGWVRTGYNFADVSTTVGHANCNLWASRSSGDNGSVAVLPQIWTAGAQDLFVWDVDVRSCNFRLGVWCKQDAPTAVYLPLVLKP